MKRSLTAALCAGGLLVSMACGVYALTGGNSLISLSYLTEKFIPQAISEGHMQSEETFRQTYDDALEKLDETQADMMQEVTGSSGSYSAHLGQRTFAAGDLITLETGAGLMMYDGSARVSHDGAVVDITDGVEVSSGAELIRGHRYLVGEDTIADVNILSGMAKLGVQSSYQVEKGDYPELPFVDIRTDDWYYDAVAYIYQAGIFTGVGDDKFDAGRTMDRAMLMTGFYRLAGSPEGELNAPTVSYTDVTQDKWYYTFVRWAGSQEITAGIGDGKFGPDMQLTREQIATLLYAFATRYLGLTSDGRTDITSYSDYAQSQSWARDALSWAVHYEILDPSWAGENTLGGHLYADRAEVAAMLAAFEENIL